MDISEEHIASIFSFEVLYFEQKTSVKAGGKHRP
jgi:hypothetical protein